MERAENVGVHDFSIFFEQDFLSHLQDAFLLKPHLFTEI